MQGKENDKCKRKGGQLLDDIANGLAEKGFPVKYFPKEESLTWLHALKNFCDFKNRKGHFINDYQSTHYFKLWEFTVYF